MFTPKDASTKRQQLQSSCSGRGHREKGATEDLGSTQVLQVRQGGEPEIQADSCSRSQSLPTKFRVMGSGVLKFMGHVDPGVLGGST